MDNCNVPMTFHSRGVLKYMVLVLLVLIELLALPVRSQLQPPQVRLPGTSTTLTGVRIHYNESRFLNVNLTLEAYRGIPFAEPPMGDRRFRYPVKKGDMGPNYRATKDKSICPQLSPMDEVMPVVGRDLDEDCLYLSVFAPSPLPTSAPVMVWIHGGGYSTMSGSTVAFEPTPLIALAPDMIVVNLNYRLGVYGFLTTGDAASPGNYGMMDQVMALEWVRDNIRAFGGDPGRVTIMGESAGAGSVGLHLLSPLSKDLFHQAVMESGNALSPWAVHMDMERQTELTRELASLLNCSESDNEALVECLRGVEERDLTAAQFAVGRWIEPLYNELLFAPVVDKHFLMDSPAELIDQGEFRSVPTLIGTNQDEGTLLAIILYPSYALHDDPPTMTLAEFRKQLPSHLYHRTPLLESAVEQWYIDWSQADNSSADQLRSFIDLNTDQLFTCPAEAMSRALVGSGAPVYRYEMTHDPSWSSFFGSPGWLGAGHGEELQYVFGWELNPSSLLSDIVCEQTDEEIVMSVQVMRYWTNFIRTGNPNGPLSTGAYPEWPRYTLPEQEYKKLSLTMENGRAMRMNSCSFWLNYAPTLYSKGDSDDLYQDWQREYEEWRDVHMTDWNQVFQEYRENGGNC